MPRHSIASGGCSAGTTGSAEVAGQGVPEVPPTLGQAVADLEAGQFVGRDAELARFRRWLAQGADATPIINVTGPGGIGKTTLLRAFHREAEQLGHAVFVVDGRSIPATPQGVLSALGAADVTEAAARVSAQPTVVSFDSFDELANLTRFLQEELLPRFDASVRIVIASRNVLGLAWRELPWGDAVRSMPLHGLTRSEVDRYLDLRSVPPAQRDTVAAMASHHPLALTLATDLVVQLGVEDLGRAPAWRQAVRHLVNRMAESVAGGGLEDVLEAAAVIRHFDEASLAAISDREDVEDAFARLCRLSVVQAGSRGLLIHDDVRRFVIEDMQWRRPGRVQQLRRRAFAHLRDRVAGAPPEVAVWLVSECAFLLESQIVQERLFQADQDTGVWIDSRTTPEELPALERLWHTSPENQPGIEGAPLSTDVPWETAERIVRHPASRVLVARDPDGTSLGFGYMVPLARDTVDLFDGPHRRAVDAGLRALGLVDLPESSTSTPALYLGRIVLGEHRFQAARAELTRDAISVWSHHQVFVGTSADPGYQDVLWAFGGFEVHAEPVPDTDLVLRGIAIDLRGLDPMTWMETLMEGRPMPPPLLPAEVERGLRQVLDGWTDDAQVADSRLAQHLTARRRPDTPDDVRASVLAAVDRAGGDARSSAARDQLRAGDLDGVVRAWVDVVATMHAG